MNDFRTRDFPLAAFLITLGFPLKETKSIGTSLLFCFPPDATDAAPLYIQGERVSARAYYSAIKDLKSLIHNSRDDATMMKIKKDYEKNNTQHPKSRRT